MTAANPDTVRRSRTTLSNHTLAMKLAEIQPSHGCTIDLVTLADILANYAKSESLTPSPDSGEAAERIDAVALCSQVSRDNSHNRNLELIEDVLNAIDHDARWYANGAGATSADIDEATHALADICEASVAEIERIADVLGCWISWFDDADQPRYKPANYWREVPASDGRLSARSRIAAVASKFKPPTDKPGIVANAERILEMTEIGLDDDGEDELPDVTELAQKVIQLCSESKSDIPHPTIVRTYKRLADLTTAVLLDYRSDLYRQANEALRADKIRAMKLNRK